MCALALPPPGGTFSGRHEVCTLQLDYNFIGAIVAMEGRACAARGVPEGVLLARQGGSSGTVGAGKRCGWAALARYERVALGNGLQQLGQ